jgi:hypothetical protein
LPIVVGADVGLPVFVLVVLVLVFVVVVLPPAKAVLLYTLSRLGPPHVSLAFPPHVIEQSEAEAGTPPF